MSEKHRRPPCYALTIQGNTCSHTPKVFPLPVMWCPVALAALAALPRARNSIPPRPSDMERLRDPQIQKTYKHIRCSMVLEDSMETHLKARKTCHCTIDIFVQSRLTRKCQQIHQRHLCCRSRLCHLALENTENAQMDRGRTENA